MFLWRKHCSKGWLLANQEQLPPEHVVIETPGRDRITVEFTGGQRLEVTDLRERFGGIIHDLPSNWLALWNRLSASKSLQIGKRLRIVRAMNRKKGDADLIIPAGAAFGTGEHATTAMSLRMLELVTRNRERGWSMLDLGTGSGIFALAATRFGAGRVIAVDNDATAIATARENARTNLVRGISFHVANARRFAMSRRVDIITANLFSELLIAVLPRFAKMSKSEATLILSGILRDQESAVLRALRGSAFKVTTIRRRGKWVAILARRNLVVAGESKRSRLPQ